MTMTTAEPRISAREALQAGWCSPACLLSQSTGPTARTGRICRCKCQGQFHGILLAYITSPPQPATAPNRAGRRRARRGRRTG